MPVLRRSKATVIEKMCITRTVCCLTWESPASDFHHCSREVNGWPFPEFYRIGGRGQAEPERGYDHSKKEEREWERGEKLEQIGYQNPFIVRPSPSARSQVMPGELTRALCLGEAEGSLHSNIGCAWKGGGPLLTTKPAQEGSNDERKRRSDFPCVALSTLCGYAKWVMTCSSQSLQKDKKLQPCIEFAVLGDTCVLLMQLRSSVPVSLLVVAARALI